MTIAAFNTPIDASAAVGVIPTKVVSIRINTGHDISPNWAIIGKVVVNNSHPTSEKVTAELLAGAIKLDVTMVVIPPNSSQSLSLQGVLVTPAGVPPQSECVQISCVSSLPAAAQFAQLMALSVDVPDPQPIC
jgi:hypothetical protein